jgi:hypothetical protein
VAVAVLAEIEGLQKGRRKYEKNEKKIMRVGYRWRVG